MKSEIHLCYKNC